VYWYEQVRWLWACINRTGWTCCGLALIGLVGLCIFAFYLLFFVVAATVAEQLPGPVQGAAWAWIQGTPQAVGRYRESDFPPGYTGQVIESGAYYWEPMYYSGPESFICQVPVDGGYLTSSYGDARPGGYSHTGVDYGSNYRPEDIYAPMGGMVTHAGYQATSSRLVRSLDKQARREIQTAFTCILKCVYVMLMGDV
jgi:hypothetical protein